MSVAQRILSKLKEIPLGIPFTPQKFIALGQRNNI